jgi:hypothetical protein
MTNDELNRWAHEFLGLGCWHEVVLIEYCEPNGYPYTMQTCRACDIHTIESGPDYTSDLNLAAKLEAAVIERVGLSPYIDAIETLLSGDNLYFASETTVYIHQFLTADALTRVRACYAAMEGK